MSSNDGFVDMPEMGGPQTPSQHGTYAGSGSPYPVGHESGGGSSGGSSIHHFPHFTPDGIPVYPPLGMEKEPKILLQPSSEQLHKKGCMLNITSSDSSSRPPPGPGPTTHDDDDDDERLVLL
jgi:hypothetical protein